MIPEAKPLITFKANIAEFERALDEQFKPALKTAIVRVLSETLDEFLTEPVPGVTAEEHGE